MTTKWQIITASIAIVLSFAAGRWSVPLSTKTGSESSQTENKTDNKSEDDNLKKHTKTTIVDTTGPDGTKTHTVTKETDLSNDKKKTESSADTRTETKIETKEVVRSGSRLTVSILAGSKITSFDGRSLELDYGAMVTKDVFGPVNVGLFGFKSGVAGVLVGVSF